MSKSRDEYKTELDAQASKIKKERAKFAAMVSFEAKDAYLGDYASFLVKSGMNHTDELAAAYFNVRARELRFETPGDLLNNRPRYEYLQELSNKHYGLAMAMVQDFLDSEPPNA